MYCRLVRTERRTEPSGQAGSRDDPETTTTTAGAHAAVSRRMVSIAIGIALLVSCSSTETSSVADTAPDQATYTIDAGDTLSGIAARAGVSVADLVTANDWPEGIDHLLLPGDVIELPLGSSIVPAGPSPATTNARPAPDSKATSAGYEPSGTLSVPSFIENQKSDPILDPLPDGQYWSWDYTSDDERVSFTLVQYFFGDACREQFGDAEDACASDNNTLSSPSTTMPLAAAAATSVIACCDDGRFTSYRVSTKEFARLVEGLAPAPDAPEGFTFARYGVIVTVRNGQAIAADQVFTS